MPKKSQFKTKEGFYSIMFHELSHWTGHKSRLNRKVDNRFGSRDYAFEELVAEISASFLCCHLGFRYETRHSAYVKSWIEVLKEDKTAIFRASSLAQKATEFILNLKELHDAEMGLEVIVKVPENSFFGLGGLTVYENIGINKNGEYDDSGMFSYKKDYSSMEGMMLIGPNGGSGAGAYMIGQ